MRKILIYGAGIFGRILKNIAEINGFEFKGFISDIKCGNNILGGFESVKDKFSPEDYLIGIGIGYSDLENRFNIYREVVRNKYQIPALIHPDSSISNSAKIADSAVIMSNVLLDIDVVVKKLTVLWPGVIINHECVIGENTFISPGAVICGNVVIGNNCFIGAGAVITEKITVPADSFVKAGTVVTPANVLFLKKFKKFIDK